MSCGNHRPTTWTANQSQGALLRYACLAQHTNQPIKLVVQLVAVWDAWTGAKRHHNNQDLDALHPIEDKKKVIALYVSAQARSPDQPGLSHTFVDDCVMQA